MQIAVTAGVALLVGVVLGFLFGAAFKGLTLAQTVYLLRLRDWLSLRRKLKRKR